MLKLARATLFDGRLCDALDPVKLALLAVLDESLPENGELPAGLDATEAFPGLEHSGCGPARRHSGVPPALHVAVDLPDADAMMFVPARERRNSGGRPSPTIVRISSRPSRIDPNTLDTLDVRGICLVLPCPVRRAVRVTGNRGPRIVALWGDPRNTADRPDPKGGAVLVNESNHLRNGRSNSAPLPGSICLHVREEGQNKPMPSSGYHGLGAVPCSRAPIP